MNNTIFLVGGFNNRPLKEIVTYRIDTGEYNKEAELFNEMARPGLATSSRVIYIFDKGKLLTYDTEQNILKEYLIDLYVENAGVSFHEGFLYIIGGFQAEQDSKRPSDKVIRIDLKVLESTAVNRTRSF